MTAQELYDSLDAHERELPIEAVTAWEGGSLPIVAAAIVMALKHARTSKVLRPACILLTTIPIEDGLTMLDDSVIRRVIITGAPT